METTPKLLKQVYTITDLFLTQKRVRNSGSSLELVVSLEDAIKGTDINLPLEQLIKYLIANTLTVEAVRFLVHLKVLIDKELIKLTGYDNEGECPWK